MPVTETEVNGVAALARLHINSESLAEVTDQFSRILAMVDDLNSVNTDGVTPMSNPHDAIQRLRADTVVPHLERDELLMNAPKSSEGYFLVPKVID